MSIKFFILGLLVSNRGRYDFTLLNSMIRLFDLDFCENVGFLVKWMEYHCNIRDLSIREHTLNIVADTRDLPDDGITL